MADRRFFEAEQGYVLGDFLSIPAVTELIGDNNCPIDNALELDVKNAQGGIGFIIRPTYLDQLQGTSISAVVCAEDIAEQVSKFTSVLVSSHPRLSYAHILDALYPNIHDTVGERTQDIDSTAELADGVKLGKGVLVGKHVRIGRGTQIGDYSIIEDHCEIGQDCRIGRYNTIQYSLIDDQFMSADHNVLGSVAFAFEPTDKGMHLIPQVGLLRIGKKVRIGNQNCIERGALGDTIIGDHVHVGCQCRFGHNVRIDEGVIIVGQCGIAGSATVGKYAQIAGKVGVNGFTHIGDFAKIMAGSLVSKDVDSHQTVFGTPAVTLREFGKKQNEIQKLVRNSKHSKD